MPLSEADARVWTDDLICREETAGMVEILEGRPHQPSQGRSDYTLRIKVTIEAQTIAVTLTEANARND